MLLTALVVVGGAEGLARLVPAPKALPFHTTRAGTIADHTLRQRPDLDVIFLGSSQCACNVSPYHVARRWKERTGEALRAYNVGMPGANTATVDVFHDAFSRWTRARRVVVLVSFALSEGGPNPRMTESYGMDWLAGRRAWPEDVLMRVDLYRYRRLFRDLRYQTYALRLSNLAGDLVRRMGPHGLGWRPQHGRFAAVGRGLAGQKAVDRYELGDESRNALASLLARAEAHGSRVLLLVPPHPPRFHAMMPDAETQWSSLDKQLRQIAAPTGADVVDQHALPELDDTAFNDLTHLFPAAARQYAVVLADTLLELDG